MTCEHNLSFCNQKLVYCSILYRDRELYSGYLNMYIYILLSVFISISFRNIE